MLRCKFFSIRTYLKYFARLLFRFAFKKKVFFSDKVIDREADLFFGYFGRRLVSKSRILVTSVSREGPMLKVYDAESWSEISRWELNCFNYQQANQQQWFDHNVIGYVNAVRGYSELCTVVRCLRTDRELVIPRALQIVMSESSFVSIDYSSFTDFAPDYAYDSEFSGVVPVSLVIFSLDDCSYNIHDLFTTSSVSDFLDAGQLEKFHLNHFVVSPDKEKLLFIARGYLRGKRVDTLVCYYFKTSSFETIVDSGYVSHYCFKGQESVLYFGYAPGASIRGYFSVEFGSSSVCRFSMLEELSFDGHPVVEGSLIVTDTYPDVFCQQHLHVFFEGSLSLHLKTFHPNILDPYDRCDLHPVVDPERGFVYVNCFNEYGKRSVARIQLTSW